MQGLQQWTDYMESILDLVTISPNEDETATEENQHRRRGARVLIQRTFLFRICDLSLPQYNTGFVYFLLSLRNFGYSYIGRTYYLRTRIQSHNSGNGSSSTRSNNLRPFALFAYICGFNNDKSLRVMQFVETNWKLKRNFLIRNGIEDPKQWAHAVRMSSMNWMSNHSMFKRMKFD